MNIGHGDDIGHPHAYAYISLHSWQTVMERVETGISGFDSLIEGGFVPGAANLVTGPAGAAKSLFGLTYLYTGATKHDEPGLYVFLRGSNLLDEDIRQHTSPLKDLAPLPGRSVHVGLRYEF